MKKWILSLVALCGLTCLVCAGEDGWMTDYKKALTLAAKTGKPILADFSGSDWCGWCMKLDREVFSQKAFKDYAKKNLILLLIDFPDRKAQTAILKKQNDELKEKYRITGYPTVLLLDGKGKVLATTGYKSGGAKKYVQYLKALLKKHKKK